MMRSFDDIDQILATLRQVWLLSPDLRLGQLLVNAANPRTPCPELFYLEDQVLLERLRSPARTPG